MDPARLIIADSEHCADMLYVSGLFVPDPFVAVELDGRWHGLFSALEVDRARRHARFHTVHLDRPWQEQATALGLPAGPAAVAAAFLAAHGVRKVSVPADFPLGHARLLSRAGIEATPASGPLFPERRCKREDEIAHIRRAERLCRRAMRVAERFLSRCAIGHDGILRHPEKGTRVRSADVRREIETFLIRRGALPMHTIVACGRESADPHQTGRGFLRAGRPIIIDIFPRLTDSGYWGDMTRTYVKGKASPELGRLYRAVREGQDIGLRMAREGVEGADIHRAILDHFTASGFPTRERKGRQEGFFHGTGHGVGLEIHEAPRISARGDVLRAGDVVTIEPGLYYPGLGGVRLEDLVVIREDGCENLTRHPRRLEIP